MCVSFPVHGLIFSNLSWLLFRSLSTFRRENMNDGKSPTWFYYAGTIVDKYGLEYVMKIDTDSLLYLDRYFNFAESSLPPAPYNTRILAGAPVDKSWWNMEKDHSKKSEPYFNKHYSSMHLYAAGQMYIMSHDLVNGVAHVAANDEDMIKYTEGHEDHDVSTMAFLALKHDEKDKPIIYYNTILGPILETSIETKIWCV
jgi:Galactosyltransferase